MRDIVLHVPKSSSHAFEVANTYEVDVNVNNTGWKTWVASKCFKVLGRLGCVKRHIHYQTKEDIKEVVISLEEIDKAVYECRDVLESLYHKRVKTLVVGRAEYSKFRESAIVRFPGDYRSNIVYQGQRLSYQDIDLVLVPWFRGIVPLDVALGEEEVRSYGCEHYPSDRPWIR